MEEKQIKLDVNHLKISFRTEGGKVQAVRDISFRLYKGETLAIVGESGSGKSVTNRAVMGILAGNAVKEGGEIIYEGQDLMKISEEEFHRIRGDKIAMIFQDPMSSLNPIMKVGKQLTEAMILKGKASQKSSRKDFNRTLFLLNEAMNGACGLSDCAANRQKCADFNKFEYKHIEMEQSYNLAKEAAEDAIADIDDILLRMEKQAYRNVLRDVAELIGLVPASINRYVVHGRAGELKKMLADLIKLTEIPLPLKMKEAIRSVFGRENHDDVLIANHNKILMNLKNMRALLAEAAAYVQPNFFAMGYYLTFSNQMLPEKDVAELNAFLRKYLDDNFMLDFIENTESAIRYSHELSLTHKRKALILLEDAAKWFQTEDWKEKEAKEQVKKLSLAVARAIDQLEIVKDNLAYTFGISLKTAVNLYLDGVKRNKKEEVRYRSRKALKAEEESGGKTGGKITETLLDLTELRNDVVNIILRVQKDFEKKIAQKVDYHEKAVAMIDYFKEKASGVVQKVTRRSAKLRALKLMEEVGIPEPRKRYQQYPFEFSGGMRQRIVIAIALSSNPDILICDEPTTALDVTIQAQILELINKVKAERKLSVIFITHNLGVVANMADRVAVMYAGQVVEIGTVNDIFYCPAHPYTWALLSSMPDMDAKDKLEAIPGTPPNMIYPPEGDAFAERSQFAMQIDFEEQPPMFAISETHFAATWLLHPNAPKINPPKAVTDRIARMKKLRGNEYAERG